MIFFHNVLSLWIFNILVFRYKIICNFYWKSKDLISYVLLQYHSGFLRFQYLVEMSKEKIDFI